MTIKPSGSTKNYFLLHLALILKRLSRFMRTPIKIRDFNMLDIHSKASLLSEAVVVDNMMKGGKGYSLYTYGSYYIEVLFDIKTSYLLEITAFYNGPKLDKYLEKIKLKECI